MNITFFIGGLSGGGAERVICNLANFLSTKKNNCTILTMAEEQSTYNLMDSVKTKTLLRKKERRNTIVDNAKRVIRLKKFIRTQSADVYIVFLPVTIIFFLLFRKCTNARVIVSERADPSRYSKLIQWMLRRLAPRADIWVFQTEDAQRWYGDVVKRKIIIPNAINEEFIRPLYEGERRKVIVAAGRLNEQKNFSMLIRAFANIADEFPDYKLEIFGEGEKRKELEQLAKDLKIEHRLSMPGYVSDLGEQIQDATLFVLSSNFEGMPNTLMEAMALGLPCISTDCPVGGPRYLIDNGENGILIPIQDMMALSNAMRDVLSQMELSIKLGNTATYIQERLKPERIYQKWENILLENNMN